LENRNYRPKHRFQAENKHRAEAEIDDFRAEEHLVVERLSPPLDKLYTSSATPPQVKFLLKYKQPKRRVTTLNSYPAIWSEWLFVK